MAHSFLIRGSTVMTTCRSPIVLLLLSSLPLHFRCNAANAAPPSVFEQMEATADHLKRLDEILRMGKRQSASMSPEQRQTLNDMAQRMKELQIEYLRLEGLNGENGDHNARWLFGLNAEILGIPPEEAARHPPQSVWDVKTLRQHKAEPLQNGKWNDGVEAAVQRYEQWERGNGRKAVRDVPTADVLVEEFCSRVRSVIARTERLSHDLQQARDTERATHIRSSLEERQAFDKEIQAVQAEILRLEQCLENDGIATKIRWVTHDDIVLRLEQIKESFNLLNVDGQAEATYQALEALNGKEYADNVRRRDAEHSATLPATASPKEDLIRDLAILESLATPRAPTPATVDLSATANSQPIENALGEWMRSVAENKWQQLMVCLVGGYVLYAVARTIASRTTAGKKMETLPQSPDDMHHDLLS